MMFSDMLYKDFDSTQNIVLKTRKTFLGMYKIHPVDIEHS